LSVAVVVAAAFVTAMIITPDWALRFSRVLAWPLVALVALLLFRLPLAQLFQGQVLRRLSGAGITAELAPREEAQFEAPDPDEFLAERAIFTLGALAQMYQFQLDFLKHLRQAENGLTSAATTGWLRTRLDQNPLTTGWLPDLTLPWLVDRGLVELRADDRYAVTALGAQFLDDIEGLWYAPKLI
jgi:hypothetical protein